MTKWVRWSGLAGFIGILAVITALTLFALPWVIKAAIEFGGTQAAGAKVTLEDVDVSLMPLGVTLEGLEVADARQPMRNLVEFDQAVADLELIPLLLGKSISDELSITNLQFNTERTVSGAIEKDEAENLAEESQPALKDQVMQELPSAKDILARETLKTPVAGKALQESWKTNKEAVDQAIAKVPTEQDLKKYQDEIKSLTSKRLTSIEDYQARKKCFDELKKQFKEDRAAITQARDQIQASRKAVQAATNDLRQAPGEDMAHLRDTYQLNSQGALNLTGLLLGDDIEGWAREALYWYEKVEPYLASGDDEVEEEEEQDRPRMIGTLVHFPTANPWPDFLIRKARITGPFDSGFLVIEGRDITHQQALLGRPTYFDIKGDQLASVGDLTAKLTLDHLTSVGKDSLTLAISDWKMAPLDLGLGGAQLASSHVQIQAKALVTQGELDADAQAQVTQAQFKGEGQTLFAKELNQALAGIKSFSLNAGAKGNLKKPSVSLGSDLDSQLQSALSQRVKAKQAELEQQLQSYLDQQVAEYAGDYADELQQLIDMEGGLDARLNSLKDMASTQLEDYAAQQKREAKEKLEAEKAAAKAKADKEKAAAEAKAKKEAKRREEELKKKAKEKLKGLF